MDWIPAIRPAGSKTGAVNALICVGEKTRNLEAVPARHRRNIIHVFNEIVKRFEIKAKKSAPSMKPEFKNGRMQIERLYCDNDSTVAKLNGDEITNEEVEKRIANFRLHLKRVHGCELILSAYGQHWQIAIAERFVALIKIGLRLSVFHSPLLPKYWDLALELLIQLYYYLPRGGIEGWSPCRMNEQRSVSFKTEIEPYYLPFGTTLSFTLHDDAKAAKAFSIFGLKGGIAWYCHKSLTRTFSITVLIGVKLVDIAINQVYIDKNPTHYFIKPLEHPIDLNEYPKTWKKGKEFLLPDPRLRQGAIRPSATGTIARFVVPTTVNKRSLEKLTAPMRKVQKTGPQVGLGHFTVRKDDLKEAGFTELQLEPRPESKMPATEVLPNKKVSIAELKEKLLRNIWKEPQVSVSKKEDSFSISKDKATELEKRQQEDHYAPVSIS